MLHKAVLPLIDLVASCSIAWSEELKALSKNFFSGNIDSKIFYSEKKNDSNRNSYSIAKNCLFNECNQRGHRNLFSAA